MPVVFAALIPDGRWLDPASGAATRWPRTTRALTEAARGLAGARLDALVFVTSRGEEPIQAMDALVMAHDLRDRAGTVAIPIDLPLAEAAVMRAADAGAPLAPTQGGNFQL